MQCGGPQWHGTLRYHGREVGSRRGGMTPVDGMGRQAVAIARIDVEQRTQRSSAE